MRSTTGMEWRCSRCFGTRRKRPPTASSKRLQLRPARPSFLFKEDGRDCGSPPASPRSWSCSRRGSLSSQRKLANSDAVPLFGQIIPLIGPPNSAVWQRRGICSDAKRIKHLQGRESACEGPEQAFFAVFPLRTGESARFSAVTPGRQHAVEYPVASDDAMMERARYVKSDE